ncbi:MAG: glycosyltransferase family 4 protein [Chloroflexota bacterium]|nr:MAG: glycosyltransferase family 1 protein [Chloroflexota bacterium]
MPITIGFDATAAARQSAGIGRYTRQLLSALAARDDPYNYKVCYAAAGEMMGSLPALDSRFRTRPLPVSDRMLNAVWHRARLPVPIQFAIGSFDLFHSPDFSLPPVGSKPSIVTVHDLAFLRRPECAFPSLRRYLEVIVPRSARRATLIIAVSECTRRDVIDLVGIAPERVVTVLEGVDRSFRPVTDRAWAHGRVVALGVKGRYILAVGTLEPRKNYVRLLEAYAALRARGCAQELVIVGGRGWRYEPIFDKLRELGLQDSVTFARPNDEDLVCLYNCADVFVYPSLYEGFGLPALEALACGAPVACSQLSSLPEVVGDAAMLFDPTDVEDMTETLWRLLVGATLQRQLRQAGPVQASRFTWAAAAAHTADLYRRVADGM